MTAALTALTAYWLVNSAQSIAWRFVSERMIRDYVIALFVCKEDLHQGAETLARLQDTYRPWREQLLPSGIHYWVVQCQELGPLPEFGPDLDQWLP